MAFPNRAATSAILMLLIVDVLADPSQRSRFLPQYYLKRFELGDTPLHTASKDSTGKGGDLNLGRQKELAAEEFPRGRHVFPPLLQNSYVPPILRSDVDYSTSSDHAPEDYEVRERRKFPEVDSRGFDEDIFDEGFGEWQPMKRW